MIFEDCNLGVSDEFCKIESSEMFLIKKIARDYFDLEDHQFTLDPEHGFLPFKCVDLGQIKEGLIAAYQSGESEAISKHQKDGTIEKELCVLTMDAESRIKGLAKDCLEVDDFDVDPESEGFNRVFGIYDLSSVLVEAYKLGVLDQINKHEVDSSATNGEDSSNVFIENSEPEDLCQKGTDTQGMDQC